MNKQTERKSNLRRIIETLRMCGPVPQARLKEQCGLQASTVSYLINDLKRENLVVDLGKEETQGRVGKPGNVVSLNNGAAVFLGMYVEDDCLYAYLVGIDGKTVSADCVEYAPSAVEQVIFATIREKMARYRNICGIGIAIKAIVYSDGRIKSGARHGGEGGNWDLVNLPISLRTAFPGLPIIVENDANSAAELYRYEEKCDNFVLYILNDIPFGIGCGLMIDGQVYRGAAGAAGEFFVKDLQVQQIHQAADRRDGALERTLEMIQAHMMQTAYLLDPERFVLTGSLFRDVSDQDAQRARAYLARVPRPVALDYGPAQSLNPARGVALRAINTYIELYLEEMTKR